MTPVLVILMGSAADRSHADKVEAVATSLGIDVEQRIGSAHKTPNHVLAILDAYRADPRTKAYVTIAGSARARIFAAAMAALAGSSTTIGATSLGMRRLDQTSSGIDSGGQEITGSST